MLSWLVSQGVLLSLMLSSVFCLLIVITRQRDRKGGTYPWEQPRAPQFWHLGQPILLNSDEQIDLAIEAELERARKALVARG